MSPIVYDNGTAKSEWATSWVVPVISAIVLTFSMTYFYTLGVFMPLIEQEMGWSRAQVSSGMMFVSITAVPLSPFIGAAIDRFGPRKVALPGSILYAMALGSLSLVGSPVSHWWMTSLALGLVVLLVSPPVMTAAVVSHFNLGRGLAIAVTLCGGGLASAIMPTIADMLQSHFGWRQAYQAMALGGGLISFILLWFFFYSASDRRKQADMALANKTIEQPPLPALSKRQAIFSPRFLRMLLAALLVNIVVTGLVTHFVPILRDTGLESRTAAAIAGLIGISSIAGRVVAGMLLDRYNAPRIGLTIFLIPAIACAIMLTNPGLALAALGALILGFALGAEFDVLAYLTSRYFDLRHYGTLFGTIFGVMSLGAGLGPLFSGLIYDQFGSYSVLFLVLMPVTIIGALLIGSLGSFPTHEKPRVISQTS